MKVLTFGVFDLLHIGHVLLFKKIKDVFGEDCHLIVAMQEDDYIAKYKPSTKMVYTQSERRFMLESVKYVDEVVTYQNVASDISHFAFDVFVKGPDQSHEGFRLAEQWCLEQGRKVEIIGRTEGISSSEIREIRKQ